MLFRSKPAVQILDEVTVVYAWAKPNPFFLPSLAGATPLYIYRPAHYLKRFHAKYTDPSKLDRLAKEQGQQNWAALHHRMDHMYRNDNPDLPALDPWVLKTNPPAETAAIPNAALKKSRRSSRRLARASKASAICWLSDMPSSL